MSTYPCLLCSKTSKLWYIETTLGIGLGAIVVHGCPLVKTMRFIMWKLSTRISSHFACVLECVANCVANMFLVPVFSLCVEMLLCVIIRYCCFCNCLRRLSRWFEFTWRLFVWLYLCYALSRCTCITLCRVVLVLRFCRVVPVRCAWLTVCDKICPFGANLTSRGPTC